jgi:AcrR family transcriptional regulator
VALEGLRELKKRETRRRISDVATGMFLERGFEAVTVTEVAAAAGVSEKTVYNYFPTKESLVLDQAEGQIERLVGAVRDRGKGVTPTAALVGALKEDSKRFYEMIADDVPRIEEFSEMVRGTPALRAAWSEHRRQMVAALATVLAEELQVEATDPEPLVAARALTGLVELLYDSRRRHAGTGGRPDQVLERVNADIERGARLLDTGMWSLHLIAEGRRTKEQIRDAAAVAEQARQQVLGALREAKRSWKQAHQQVHEAAREAHQQAHEAAREARQQAQEAAREARQQAQEARQQAQEAAREARRQARRGR